MGLFQDRQVSFSSGPFPWRRWHDMCRTIILGYARAQHVRSCSFSLPPDDRADAAPNIRFTRQELKGTDPCMFCLHSPSWAPVISVTSAPYFHKHSEVWSRLYVHVLFLAVYKCFTPFTFAVSYVVNNKILACDELEYSLNILTSSGLQCRGSVCGRNRNFFVTTSRLALGSIKVPMQCVMGALFLRVK